MFSAVQSVECRSHHPQTSNRSHTRIENARVKVPSLTVGDFNLIVFHDPYTYPNANNVKAIAIKLAWLNANGCI